MPPCNTRLQHSCLHHLPAIVPCWSATINLRFNRPFLQLRCRTASFDSKFDLASLEVLHGVTNLTFLDLTQKYGRIENGKSPPPPELLVAAVAGLKQRNPTLEVCVRINQAVRSYAVSRSLVEANLQGWHGRAEVMHSGQLAEDRGQVDIRHGSFAWHRVGCRSFTWGTCNLLNRGAGTCVPLST